jgi:membrane associated rhomboid family serine protease
VLREGIDPRGFLVRVADRTGGLTECCTMVPARLAEAPAAVWYTVLSAMFLHAGWLHLLGNMLYLWIFGNNIEDTLGHVKFLAFYLACGVAAAMAHVATGVHSEVPTLGASGAVAGVMGAYVLLFPHARILAIVPLFVVSTITEVPAIVVLGFWALIQFANANWLGGGSDMQGGGVAYFAHIGGFVAGLVFIALLGGRKLVRAQEPRYHRWE